MSNQCNQQPFRFVGLQDHNLPMRPIDRLRLRPFRSGVDFVGGETRFA